MTLYFAYGSNLLHQRLQRRCPSARPTGTGHAPGWRVGFAKYSWMDGSGKATILAEAGAATYGVLYRLVGSDLATLDAIEGVGKGYDRLDGIEVRTASGALTATTLYRDRPARGTAPIRLVSGPCDCRGSPELLSGSATCFLTCRGSRPRPGPGSPDPDRGGGPADHPQRRELAGGAAPPLGPPRDVARLGRAQEVAELVRRHRRPEGIALHDVAAHVPEQAQLRLGLHPPRPAPPPPANDRSRSPTGRSRGIPRSPSPGR